MTVTTTTRPDEATGFRHIGDPANALIERINATRHPNVVKMHDAIDVWVKEAGGRADEADLLDRRVSWLEQQSAILSGPGDIPEHLVGVGAFDMTAAIGRLVSAAQRARS